MEVKKTALIKKHSDLIEKALVKLSVKTDVDKVKIDIAKTVIDIVKANDDVITLPVLYTDLIRVMLNHCILELPTFHENPLAISEEEKTLLQELIQLLS